MCCHPSLSSQRLGFICDVYMTLYAELGMMIRAFGEMRAATQSLKEGIDIVRVLGTALTAALAIRVTASQCSSKLW